MFIVFIGSLQDLLSIFFKKKSLTRRVRRAWWLSVYGLIFQAYTCWMEHRA